MKSVSKPVFAHTKTARAAIIFIAFCNAAAYAQTSATAADKNLPTVTVTDTPDANALPKPYSGGQVSKGARVGILGNVGVFETPFSTQSYTTEFVQDQQARRVADVITVDPAVRSVQSEYGDTETYIIRGFPAFTAQVGIDGLYGLADQRRLAPEFYERIDVLKGPSSMLYGAAPFGSVGGQINLVSKRAADAPLTRLTGVYVGKGQLGGHIDLGRRFGTDNAWGLRINALHRSGSTPISDQKDRMTNGSIALDYRGDRLRASLDMASQSRKTDAQIGNLVYNQGFALPAAPDLTRNFANPWEYYKSDGGYTIARVEFDLAKNLTAYASHGTYGAQEEYYYAAAQGRRVINTAGNFTGRTGGFRGTADAKSTEVGLRGEARFGGVSNRFALSYSLLERTTKGLTVLVSPVYTNNLFTAPTSLAPVVNYAALPQNSGLRFGSLGLVNTVGLLNDTLLITLGLREQRIRQGNFVAGVETSAYEKMAATPSAAVLFKLTQQTSVYANYSEGLAQGSTAPVGTLNAGEVFAPFSTKQYEAGVKYDAGTFGITGAVFQIAQPSAFTNAANRFVVDGEQRNRGLELATFGEPVKGLRLLGGVAYTSAIQTKTLNGVDNGKPAVGVPKWAVVANAEYDVSAVPGLSLTGRATHNSMQFADNGNTQSIPAWTRWDIGARYATKLGGHATTIRANIVNVAGKNYWQSVSRSFLSPGVPRALMVSVSTDF